MNTIVIENTDQGDVAVDVFQKLASSRVLFVSGDITDDLAADISATLLVLEAEDPTQEITMFINSRGGDIRNALGIYDIMCKIKSPIKTVCLGSAMKEAVILLTAGAPGKRYASKHAILCVGQLENGWAQHSDLTDAESLLKHSLDDNKRMMTIFAQTTGKSMKDVNDDLQRVVFMDSQQAKRYGFVDKICQGVS